VEAYIAVQPMCIVKEHVRITSLICDRP